MSDHDAAPAADSLPSMTPFREASIPKLSERASGLLTYRVAVDGEGALHLSVVANQGGAYFSTEWVPFQRVRECLGDLMASGASFPTARLLDAYHGRSVNNGGFLAAILRHEGLLQAGDPPTRHRVSGDWDAWETAQHELAASGVPLASASSPSGVKGRRRGRRSRATPSGDGHANT
ncbi:hypothetical protein [Imhoffiella purpurea]|nr:hypothetical protein [Imhoffiella purpurea]